MHTNGFLKFQKRMENHRKLSIIILFSPTCTSLKIAIISFILSVANMFGELLMIIPFQTRFRLYAVC